MLASTILFANDAACLISEKHRMKTVRVESRLKILPFLAVIFAVITIPVGAAALFFGPLMDIELLLALTAKVFGVSRDNIGISGEDIRNAAAGVYIVLDITLELSAFVSICRIITEKSAVISPRKQK